MNFPGVFMGDERMHAEMAETRAAGKVVGGHYASLDLGLPFHGYAAGGPQDDHEGTRMEDAVARVRQGMKAMLRLGSAWYDVASQLPAITELGLDSRNFILCTDDSHSGTLVNDGHMDRVLRHAIDEGLDPLTAIQMMTINTAEHFGVSQDVGMIAPGRYADIVIADDLADFAAELVLAKGAIIARQGKLEEELPSFVYPEWATNSVKLGRALTAADFELETGSAGHDGTVQANVIGVIENQAPTRHLQMDLAAQNGQVRVDMAKDVAKIALVERHKGTGAVQVALVHGFGFNVPCAVATTVAHDSHHMIVVGTSEEDMAIAANELGRVQGGQIVISEGQTQGLVELPIAGLMSNERAETVAEKTATVLQGFRNCGCELNNANMQLSLLALVVIPDLRISDKGLVDVNQFDFVPVVT